MDALVKVILDLREQGLSYSKIGQQLDIPKATIGWIINNPYAPRKTDAKYDWEKIRAYYAEGHTVEEVCEYFGTAKGTIHKAVLRGDFQYRHKEAAPLSEILVEDSNYQRVRLRQRLIREGILENQCAICGQLPIWNNEPLTLQLDHINGHGKDNRIENLRIICPNCHSQTPTFAGRKLKQPDNTCIDCGTKICRESKRCMPCANTLIAKNNKENLRQGRPSRRKFPHPTAEELRTLIWSKPIVQVAKDLGVSDVAIHKLCRKLGVEKPPKGYFLRGKPRVW